MTNKTAISILTRFMKMTDLAARKYSKDKTIKSLKEALELAIKALEEKTQNELSCMTCDHFGIDCGDCEVNDDDG